MVRFSLLLLFVYSFQVGYSQNKKVYKPSMQTCNCNFKIDSSYMASVPARLKADSTFPYNNDSSFRTICGYLIVPENRRKASSGMIRLPFIVLKSKNPDKKQDPLLFTTGGPGGSSLGWINGMQKSSVIESRDCIAFEQRGTQFAIPSLRSFELDTAIREAYRKNLNKDSMWLEGVKRYKKKLEKKGIDLSGYNTDETVADIIDLLKVLKIDSVNLYGVSYSGGLMLAVLQKEPSKVRSLVLDSPLPTFVPIDEEEPMNFVKAIAVLSGHCEKDSSNQQRYGSLATRFENYFNSIADKKFYFPYVEKGTVDTLQVEYTKNELLDLLDNTLQDASAIKNVPFMITEMISGNHAPYIQKKLDDIFNKNIAPNGMRISVYCADQANYHSEERIQQLWRLYPLLSGYHINDVYKAFCDCWKVPPVNVQTRQPFHSNKPVLIGDGEMDPACSPLYMSRIKQYMPNAQCFLFINRSHGVGGATFRQMAQTFLDDPYHRIQSHNEKVIAY
ncbi:alpha/beta fold hydrolase [Niastella vici]|nr:alpha/beta hydrolase [Niastella vici]